MNAIIYTSETGHTEKYAQMLSEKTGIPAFSADEADDFLQPGTRVIYFGWLKAGSVVGLSKARRNYRVRVICVVGMTPESQQDKTIGEVTKKYRIKKQKVFYLRGGFQMSELHGKNKIMMMTMEKILSFILKNKKNKTEEEASMLAAVTYGADWVNPDRLEQVVAWIGRK